MINCDFHDECPFFNNDPMALPMQALELRTRYCQQGANCGCSLYIINRKLGADHIPNGLYPNQLGKVREILGFL